MLNRQVDKHKKIVLQVFLLSSVVAASVFAVLNVYRNHYLLAGLEFFVAAFSLTVLVYMYWHKDNVNIELLSLIYVLLFCSFLTYAFSSEKSSDSIFIWALVIPMVSYLLLGVKVGFMVTAVFFSTSAWFFLARFSGHPSMSEHVSYGNVFFTSSLFWILSHAYEFANQRTKNQLRKMAVKDHLTNLYNRILLERIFNEMQEAAVETGEQLGMLLLDLDHFKEINDQYGHAIGDQVLIEFAQIIESATKDQGESFRIGGEEFLILIPLSYDTSAYKLAESIRVTTQKMKIEKMQNHEVTVSVGMVINGPSKSIEDMLKLADNKLYQAKQQGRNRVVA